MPPLVSKFQVTEGDVTLVVTRIFRNGSPQDTWNLEVFGADLLTGGDVPRRVEFRGPYNAAANQAETTVQALSSAFSDAKTSLADSRARARTALQEVES